MVAVQSHQLALLLLWLQPITLEYVYLERRFPSCFRSCFLFAVILTSKIACFCAVRSAISASMSQAAAPYVDLLSQVTRSNEDLARTVTKCQQLQNENGQLSASLLSHEEELAKWKAKFRRSNQELLAEHNLRVQVEGDKHAMVKRWNQEVAAKHRCDQLCKSISLHY